MIIKKHYTVLSNIDYKDYYDFVTSSIDALNAKFKNRNKISTFGNSFVIGTINQQSSTLKRMVINNGSYVASIIIKGKIEQKENKILISLKSYMAPIRFIVILVICLGGSLILLFSPNPLTSLIPLVGPIIYYFISRTIIADLLEQLIKVLKLIEVKNKKTVANNTYM